MKKNILLVNNTTKNCGVYQYGKRCANIFLNSTNYNIKYIEVDNLQSFLDVVNSFSPNIIIYNYVNSTLPFITPDIVNSLKQLKIKNGCIVHNYQYTFFDFYLHQNPNYIEHTNNFKLLRPLFNYNCQNSYKVNEPIKIGSFGFGFKFKKYDLICKLINDEFLTENVEIRLHLTDSFYGNNFIEKQVIAEECYKQITRSNIKLNITFDFITDEQLLDFLHANDLNVFLYENYKHYNGISSVIDYALSVKKPIAICKSSMFGHIMDSQPSICVEDTSLKTIINNGTKPLEHYYEKWSCNNFKIQFENIVDTILNG